MLHFSVCEHGAEGPRQKVPFCLICPEDFVPEVLWQVNMELGQFQSGFFLIGLQQWSPPGWWGPGGGRVGGWGQMGAGRGPGGGQGGAPPSQDAALAILRSSWLHPPSAALTPVGFCVFTGVDGGAVRVMGAKGVAPSCDYKVKDWTQPCVSPQQQHHVTFVLRPGVCHLPGWLQGHSRLSGCRTTCGRKGPSHR